MLVRMPNVVAVCDEFSLWGGLLTNTLYSNLQPYHLLQKLKSSVLQKATAGQQIGLVGLTALRVCAVCAWLIHSGQPQVRRRQHFKHGKVLQQHHALCHVFTQ